MKLNREERFADVEEFWQAFCDAAGEKKASSTEVTQLSTGELPDIQVRPIEDITTIFKRKENDIPVVKRSKVPQVLLTVFLLLGITGGILYFGVYPRLRAFHPALISTAIARPTHAPTSILHPTISLYPMLAQEYDGTTSPVEKATPGTTVSSPTQTLQFFDIKQKDGSIQGHFNGLAQAGSFSGTLTKNSAVTFIAPLYNGQSKVVFSGDIQTNGSIGGNYTIYNPNGQQIGDPGIWTVTPKIG